MVVASTASPESKDIYTQAGRLKYLFTKGGDNFRSGSSTETTIEQLLPSVRRVEDKNKTGYTAGGLPSLLVWRAPLTISAEGISGEDQTI